MNFAWYKLEREDTPEFFMAARPSDTEQEFFLEEVKRQMGVDAAVKVEEVPRDNVPQEIIEGTTNNVLTDFSAAFNHVAQMHNQSVIQLKAVLGFVLNTDDFELPFYATAHPSELIVPDHVHSEDCKHD